MFFLPTDILVQEYVDMIKRQTMSLNDVPHYLNLKQSVELELRRQEQK